MRCSTQPLRVVDLFCGAGGMSLGFHAAGFRIVGGADSDELAASSFRANFSILQHDCPPEVYGGPAGDLNQLDFESLGRRLGPDVLIGGPPCQAYSRIGRAKPCAS